MHEISRRCIKKHTGTTDFVHLLRYAITKNEFNGKSVNLHLSLHFLAQRRYSWPLFVSLALQPIYLRTLYKELLLLY